MENTPTGEGSYGYGCAAESEVAIAGGVHTLAVLRPVPTAVPPRARWYSDGSVVSTRSIPYAICHLTRRVEKERNATAVQSWLLFAGF